MILPLQITIAIFIVALVVMCLIKKDERPMDARLSQSFLAQEMADYGLSGGPVLIGDADLAASLPTITSVNPFRSVHRVPSPA